MHPLIPTLTLLTILLTGCVQRPGEAIQPTCIAIGGGLDDANTQVFQAMTARPTDKVVVVAYATANFDGAGARFAQRLAQHNWSGTVAQLPDVLAGQPAINAFPAAMHGADLVFFTGGDQSRIMQRMAAHPPLKAAMLDALNTGTVIAGTSAGAAFMSDPMFVTGGSESALAGTPATDGEPDTLLPGEKPKAPRTGPQTGPGMGIVKPMIDTHFHARGRHGRLVAALEATGNPYGLGIDEDRAVVITAGTHCKALGPHAATLIDVSSLKREGLTRRNARISLLADGDTWVYPQPGQPAQPLTSPRILTQGPVPITPPAPHAALSGRAPDAWSKNIGLDMLKRLATDPSTPQRMNSKAFEVVISADEQTRFGFNPSDPDNLTIINARLDIIARP